MKINNIIYACKSASESFKYLYEVFNMVVIGVSVLSAMTFFVYIASVSRDSELFNISMLMAKTIAYMFILWVSSYVLFNIFYLIHSILQSSQERKIVYAITKKC